jgi:hypothetical protein
MSPILHRLNAGEARSAPELMRGAPLKAIFDFKGH